MSQLPHTSAWHVDGGSDGAASIRSALTRRGGTKKGEKGDSKISVDVVGTTQNKTHGRRTPPSPPKSPLSWALYRAR